MPVDPVFQSDWQPHASHRTLQPVQVEYELGRSDARLGEVRCPWPLGDDANEWQRGFDEERKSWIPEDVRKRRDKRRRKNKS